MFEHRDFGSKPIICGHVQKVCLESFRLFRTNSGKQKKSLGFRVKSTIPTSPRIRDAGMEIESSGCAYVYISDDMGGGGVSGVWWGCGAPGGGGVVGGGCGNIPFDVRAEAFAVGDVRCAGLDADREACGHGRAAAAATATAAVSAVVHAGGGGGGGGGGGSGGVCAG